MFTVSRFVIKYVKNTFQDVKEILARETKEASFMVDTYKNNFLGDKNKEELAKAHYKMRDILKIIGLAPLLIAPGTVITIPLIVKLSKKYKLKFLPRIFYRDVPKLESYQNKTKSTNKE